MQYQLKKNIFGNYLQPVMRASSCKQRLLVRVFVAPVVVALLLGLVCTATFSGPMIGPWHASRPVCLWELLRKGHYGRSVFNEM